jgi:hypothetical protein
MLPKCQQCISPEPNLFAHNVQSSRAQVVNSDFDVSCALDQEEDVYGNNGTVPVDQVSQVSQDNKVTTYQEPMVEGLHRSNGKGAPDQARNIGGWPKSSTSANKQKKELQQKKVVNWVISRYSDAKEEASTANETSLVQIQVSDGVLNRLIKKAIIMFKLTSDVDVPKTTIH